MTFAKIFAAIATIISIIIHVQHVSGRSVNADEVNRTTPFARTIDNATEISATGNATRATSGPCGDDGTTACWFAATSAKYDDELKIVENTVTSIEYNESLANETDDEPEWVWGTLDWRWYTILQLISGILGSIGNLLVAVIIFQRRSSARSTDILIGSLAIADFLTSIFIIPSPSARRVPNSWTGMLACLILYPDTFLWISVTASSYILMAISIDRFIAVVYPLHFKHIVTIRRVNIAIAVIWLAAFLSLSFTFFVIKVDETSHECTFTITTDAGYAAMGYFWFSVRIIVPVLTMLITQSIIAVKLHIQSSTFKANETSAVADVHIKARNRVIGMMLIVILVYIVCWLPNQVAFLGYLVGFVPLSYFRSPLHRVLTVLGYYNSCANPFIYLARNPNFRIALKEFFTCTTNKNESVFSQKADPVQAGQAAARGRKTTDARLGLHPGQNNPRHTA
ncbi:allatostatin-A receptor-like [Diadema antillarum]|uniref:allatostatin-A receptor-like n=1 Tax=Diadema antillarum TaxID=105358 RepID=UPI003A8425E3